MVLIYYVFRNYDYFLLLASNLKIILFFNSVTLYIVTIFFFLTDCLFVNIFILNIWLYFFDSTYCVFAFYVSLIGGDCLLFTIWIYFNVLGLCVWCLQINMCRKVCLTAYCLIRVRDDGWPKGIWLEYHVRLLMVFFEGK